MLVIEEPSASRKLLIHGLKTHKFDILLADDGPAGLEMIKQEKLSFVICSIELPVPRSESEAVGEKAREREKYISIYTEKV